MIDLHNHLLFGMDDGAKDLEDSLALFNIQIDQGIRKVVLTPHFAPSYDGLKDFIELRDKNANMLKQALKQGNVDVDIKLGAEILYSVDMMDLDLDKLVMEDTDYLLIEFSTRGYVGDLKRNIAYLLDRGYLPIFAHIERYSFLRSDLELMKDLVDMGVMFQVNAESFFDKNQKNFIKACMKHNLIHLVATDAHSIKRRPPNLKEAYNVIEKDYGKDALRSFIDNAKAVYLNEIPETKAASQLKTFLGKYY